MAETCLAPDGTPQITFGMSNANIIYLVAILGMTPMFLLFMGPKILFWLGGTLGYYLRKKTAGRKAQVLELVEQDEAAWIKEGKEKGERRDSDEWESVDAYAAGSAKNGEKGEEEWDGIVGFFHPFWFASPIAYCIRYESLLNLVN